ncbi:2-amino-4-hydroxy-6-hydroxymethyldihydropteridine diphosphokinase [Natronoflexus pectinivorans]|uniref:2-amino-4-hydroxy-6-hydroxymethyldihydropteridine pyrophosphokinase n=1 Tax=Natronoflexus pectinivorans TaxID=682526 RepID=A0A4R2GDL2_9BACT|nr:2-amino-4-hydroxy-6-hydroxymethyldihydropteridine diphosphokinase [Natronoflexus pectinivorans]TCO05399.1 2-amino-4-hydroxy-6-hydroxymethyldihydropteridine diphosphokinase [Natronoflexus pectinivorans]
MNRMIISIGSNIEPFHHIKVALGKLQNHFEVLSVSSLQTTKPIGIVDQQDFINGAVLATTNEAKKKVNIILKKIENEMGRDRTVPKFGPRNIDLDLLIWNDEVVDDDYHTRPFLQEAVKELQSI